MPLLSRLGLRFSSDELERRYRQHAQEQYLRFDVASTLVDILLSSTSLARDVAAGKRPYFVAAHLALALAYLALLLARRDFIARRRSYLMALRRLSVALVVPYVLLPAVTSPAESWGGLLRNFNAAGLTSLILMSIQFRDVQFVINAALNAMTSIYFSLTAAPHICSLELESPFSRSAVAKLSAAMDALTDFVLHGRLPEGVAGGGGGGAEKIGAAEDAAGAAHKCVPVLVSAQARAPTQAHSLPGNNFCPVVTRPPAPAAGARLCRNPR
jgi:hypothetical protein